MVTAGAVDAALGGVTAHWSLLWFGIGMAGVAIALRWLQARRQQERIETRNRPPAYVLPPAGTRLPTLALKKQPPRE